MIDHLSIGVRDLDRAMRFYDAVLAPLGYVRVLTHPGDVDHPFRSACYGPPGTDPIADPHLAPFWLEERPDPTDGGSGSHVCFGAPSRTAVEQFHAAGLANGATDYGAPGLREHYGPGYYAAFLIDPWGWRIEAVTFKT
jgi:catechol 2,3-dioxygenase-like lactoylglutathione lyase family enzyme